MTPALVLFTLACSPTPALPDASVRPDDAGVILEWSAPDADVVLLLDGDNASVESQSGSKWLPGDRTRIVRVATLRGQTTSWATSRIDAHVTPRVGGRGTLLLGDERPATGQPVTVNGVDFIASADGTFAVPDGVEPYSLFYRFTYGPFADLHANVLVDGATASAPVLYSNIGNDQRVATVVVRVASLVGTAGRANKTSVNVRVGSQSASNEMDTLSGQMTFRAFMWHGSPTTTATVTAVRHFVKSIITENSYDRPEIQGASAPVEIELRDGETTEVDLTIDPVEPDLRDLYLPSEFSNDAALITYSAPGEGSRLYSGRAHAQAKVSVVPRTGYSNEWIVREPSPVPENMIEHGKRGSGDFVVPNDGPIIAPLYQAPRFISTTLSVDEPVLRWEMPQQAVCKLWVTQPFGLDEWFIYAVGMADLRKAGIHVPGRYQMTLDCYPELATVDDLLVGRRARDFAQGLGRRARVVISDSVELR